MESQKGIAKKKIKPSEREKKRYIVFSGNFREVVDVLSILGRDFKIIASREKRTMARVFLKDLTRARVLADSKGVGVVGLSGTIKRAKQKFFNKL
ncbi:MAG: hypothetical protein V1660_04050 [archaeon]